MAAAWSPDFLDLLTALNGADAKYLLVGGHAVGLFGRPRATKDFDLWIEASTENAAKVIAALRAFGAPLADLTEADLSRPGFGYRMGQPPFRIELLTEISGVGFAAAWPRREVHDLGGVACPVIARDDLIANKLAAGRPQDLADVAFLQRQR
ncbi:MAG: nucleotidyl transferase AbiEii/AbiGii toxin family protein [Myxococcales bacterium]|nr:nucleotidyl transferase AbiEii/AbiGii toxin family protein [Myxococcales bacterium]